ncbi:MAG: superoxide dismutase [Candidatus Pacebacteria bacterium]|nr:superoxide dismutase [Candidatus Paceibacterota bacterium]
MKKYEEIKKLSFSKPLTRISEKTISIHYDKLYQGYVKKWQEIQEKLKEIDKSTSNATFSDLRELKLEEGFAADAILLHEAYFDVLGGNGNPEGDIVDAIAKDFGSFEAWREEFEASGLAARGWVVLAYDFNDGKLHNYIADLHNQGGVWGTSPILVLDVYEHAYFIDYGSDRKNYIEAFFQNLNWEAINKKFLKIVRK